MAKLASLVLVAVLLAACAGPQPSLYAPLESGDGYAEVALPKGLHRVTFQGNLATSRERAETYVLYRAAELTLELGAESFVVHDKLTERLTRVTRDWTYGPFGYAGYRFRAHRYGPGSVIERETTTYRAHLTIEPFSGNPPSEGFQHHDARAVVNRLAEEIRRPSEAAGN